MKKIGIVLILSTFSLNLFCQQDDAAELDSYISYRWDTVANDWVPEYRTEYTIDSLGNYAGEISDYWDLETRKLYRYRRVLVYDADGNLTESIYYDWDTITNDWVGIWRSVSAYDTNGNGTEYAYYEWDKIANDWMGSWRGVYVYDDNGNLTEYIYYDWDTITNDWIGYDRTVGAYDANGNLTEYICYDWDTITNDWIGYDRAVGAYDANGNPTEDIYYDWDTITNDWIRNERRTYVYDSTGNQTEDVWYDWDTKANDWVGAWRDVYAYDSTGYRTEWANYFWDTITNNWVGSYRYSVAYDANGNMTEWVDYEWDTEANDWIGTYRYVSTYDANGNMTEEISYWWDTEANDWIGTYRYVSTYDANGNMIEWAYYDWDSETNDWICTWREVHNYDSNGNRIERVNYEWDYNTNAWIYRSKTEYYWSCDLIWDQIFFVDENCSEGSVLGSVITGSKYSNEQIQWSLIRGNPDHLFAIDSVAGDVLLSQSGILDYETTSMYNIAVEAHFEDSTGIITDTSKIMIFITNVNDNAPVVNDTTFEISEDAGSIKDMGRISVSDADGDLNPLTISIVSGNENNIFNLKFSSSTGVRLYLMQYDSIDYEKQPFYALTVQVSDGTFTDEAIVTIQVIDVDETSLDNIESGDHLKLYPNPAFEELHIDVPDLLSDGFELLIMDLSGNIVYQKSGCIKRIDLSSFQKGVYLITIRSKDFVTTRKIIKL